VGDAAGQAPEPLDLLRLHQLRFQALLDAQVAHEPGKVQLFRRTTRQCQLYWKFVAIGALGGEFDMLAQERAVAGLHTSGQGLAMLIAERRRDNQDRQLVT
jgi:hypothetical protein